MKKILMIVGSLRKNAFNLQLAKQVEKALDDKAVVSFLEYADLPFLNQDMEFPAPEPVSLVRKAVADADAIWFFTPEYNYHIPGVLKNLLDWLSRPVQPNDRSRNSVIRGKIAVISSVAGKSAGAGARKNLKNLLDIMSVEVVSNEGFSADGEAFQTDHLVITEDITDALRKQAEKLWKALNE